MRGFWNNQEPTAGRIVDGWSGFQRNGNARTDVVDFTGPIPAGWNEPWGEDRRYRSPTATSPKLENVIAAHADVVKVAVFGILDERWDEQVAASPRPSFRGALRKEASVTQKELVELCSVHLGNYKWPGKVVLRRQPLAKTPVGKIKRTELREPFCISRERPVAGN